MKSRLTGKEAISLSNKQSALRKRYWLYAPLKIASMQSYLCYLEGFGVRII